MDASLSHCGLLGATYLLLFYVYGLETAAHCPSPEGGENTVLSNEAILMNDFPEGTTVSLECANGYEKDRGSENIHCIDGIWTTPDLQCKKKDCGPPTPRPHMSFDLSGGTLFTDVIKVICDEGFQVIGSSFKQCYSTGWIGRAKCQIVKCNKPAEVTNGRSSWMSEGNPQYGDAIEYSCNEGYNLRGAGLITCSKTGQYDFQPPECIGVTTEALITSQISTTTTTTTTTTPTQTQEASSSTDATSPREETFRTPTVLSLQPLQGGATDKQEVTSSATATSLDTIKNTDRTTFYSMLSFGTVAGFVGVLIGVFYYHKKKKGSATMPI